MQSAASTIDYEFEMLYVAGHLLGAATDQAATNVALESFLVHARNLRDFFAGSGDPDDILAIDFVLQIPSVSMPHVQSKSTRDRINRLISHASYSRPSLDKNWNPQLILTEIGKAMEVFLNQLRSEDQGRAGWFPATSKILGS